MTSDDVAYVMIIPIVLCKPPSEDNERLLGSRRCK